MVLVEKSDPEEKRLWTKQAPVWMDETLRLGKVIYQPVHFVQITMLGLAQAEPGQEMLFSLALRHPGGAGPGSNMYSLPTKANFL